MPVNDCLKNPFQKLLRLLKGIPSIKKGRKKFECVSYLSCSRWFHSPSYPLPPFYYLLKSLLIGQLVLLSLPSPAQNPQPAFRNYTTDDGLPSLAVYHILEDSKGYIWFATNQGICRFNGYEFEKFPAPKEVNYISAFKMREDERGRIWFNTMAGNIYYWEQDTIRPYAHNDLIVSNVDKYSICADVYTRGLGDTLWVHLDYYGVLEIRQDGSSVMHQNQARNDDILFDLGGQLMNINGYAHSNIKADEYILPLEIITDTSRMVIDNFILTSEISSRITSHKIDNSTYLHFRNFHLYLIKNGQITWHQPYKEDIVEMIPAKDGSIFFCELKSNGYKKFKSLDAIKKGTYEQYLKGFSITWVLEDSRGGRWISTLQQGIFYAADADFSIYNQEAGLSDNTIQAITKGDPKELYIGLRNGDVFHLNVPENVLTSLPVTKPSSSIVYQMQYDPIRKTLWTGKIRLYAYQNKAWKFIYYLQKQGTQGSYISRKLRLMPDKNQLVGAAYQGFAVLDLNTKNYNYISAFDGFKDRVYFTLPIINGNIWIGVEKGLHLFKNKQLSQPNNLPDALKGRLVDGAEMKDGTLVFGAIGGGVLLWKEDYLQEITTADGLTTNAILNIYVDEADNIWAGTSLGLNKIKRLAVDSFEVQQLTVAHGLPSNVVNQVLFAEGYYWIATSNGLVKMSQKETDPISLRPIVESITVNQQPTPTDTATRFSHQQNDFQFQFFVLNYKEAGQNTYRYRIQDQQDWTVSDNTTAIFTDLPPNEYQFEVQAQNEDGVWSASTIYPFTIAAPFWERTWFLLLCLLALGLFAYALFKYRLTQIETQNQTERAINDLQQAALRAQINPHFIFNCLNSIQHFIANNDAPNANRYLAQFASLIRGILNSSTEKRLPLVEDIQILTNYLELEQLRFKDQFQFEIEVDPAIDQFETMIPPLIIQPYVENAIKHGLENKEEQGRIRISYQLENQQIVIQIKDNGKGIYQTQVAKNKKEGLHKSLGMDITQKRLTMNDMDEAMIEEIKGATNSILGTRITLRLPR